MLQDLTLMASTGTSFFQKKVPRGPSPWYSGDQRVSVGPSLGERGRDACFDTEKRQTTL